MPLRTADIEYLSLLVQRLLDAEVLRDAEGATLLSVAAGRRCLCGPSACRAGRPLHRSARPNGLAGSCRRSRRHHDRPWDSEMGSRRSPLTARTLSIMLSSL